MREYATPPVADSPVRGNLTDDLLTRARVAPDDAALARKTSAGWEDVSTVDFLAEVRAVAKGLVAAGIEPGQRVGIMSGTRYEWTLLDYAIWYAGGAGVPLYETASPDRTAWILSDSGAVALVCETTTQAAAVDEIGDQLPDLRRRWVIDEGAIEELTALGAGVSDEQLERRRSTAGPADLATIVYTSGTTGRAKGCPITHGALVSELDGALSELHELFEEEGAATLLFLPLAHIFARVIQVGAIRAGARLGHVRDVKRLREDLATFRPTFVLGVPRVFELLFNTASQEAAADGRGRLFDQATETAIAYSKALDTGRPGVLLRARHALYDRLVYHHLRETLGGRCRYAVSGGAPLGERLGHFYRGLGLVVLEGYGLTETTAAVTANTPTMVKIGTVGRPLPGVSVRVADDGELLVRGDQVFDGYWRNSEATAEVLDHQGWFHTGDLGEIDEEGFVRIAGRKKELLITAGGKNVSPTLLEDRLRAHPLVSQCLVVGDKRPYVAALITMDPDSVRLWAERLGKPSDPALLVDDADLRAELQKAVDDANQAVSQAEGIRRFTVLDVDWTEEAGHLTPSLKLRRTALMRDFAPEVEALYDLS
ncbi:MAG: AMP-dependent synthetase/ligase [Actinomycetota bacterium]